MKKIFNLISSKKRIILICCAILFVIIFIRSRKIFQFSAAQDEKYKAFIIAKKSLHKGDTLTIENTDVVFLDVGAGWKKFVRNAEFESFEGLQIREDIDVNLPILKKNVMTFKPAEANIPRGKRLFVLDASIGPILSVLNINDVVDVIAQINMPNLGNVTETILEAVKIVAIGNHSDSMAASEGENPFLSFYLTPEEVKIISFMKPYSNFSVVLRNSSDIVHTKEHAVTLNRFIQNEKIQKIIQSDAFRIINGRNVKSSK